MQTSAGPSSNMSRQRDSRQKVRLGIWLSSICCTNTKNPRATAHIKTCVVEHVYSTRVPKEHVYSTRVPKAEWEEGVGEPAETHEPARRAHTAVNDRDPASGKSESEVQHPRLSSNLCMCACTHMNTHRDVM